MTDSKSRHTSGIFFVLGAALLWSFGGLGIKVVHAHPIAIAGYRSLFALPVVTLSLFWVGRNTSGARSRWTEIKTAVLRKETWVAALAYGIAVMLFVGATRLTTAAAAILLQYTSPVWVALLSPWLLGERVRAYDWLAVGGCVLGMLCFGATALRDGALLGDAIALCSGFGFGLLTLMLRREALEARRRGEPGGGATAGLLAVVLGNVIGVLLASPWMVTGGPTDAKSVVVLGLLGVGQIGVAYVLFVAGTARVTAIEAGLVSNLEPVLNPLWVMLGYGERPGTMAIVGGALIVVSVSARGLLAARAN